MVTCVVSLSCRLPMPTVTAGQVNVEYQLGLVRDGAIQHFAGYLPGDNDTFIPAVLTVIAAAKKVSKKGLNVIAIPHVPNGSLPEQHAGGARITVHSAGSRVSAKRIILAQSTWLSGRGWLKMRRGKATL